MTDITSHSGGFPTAYTQLGTSNSAPQVDTIGPIISGLDTQVLNVPYVSNLWLALEIIHNGKGYNIVDPENFLKGGSEHE